MTIIAQPLTASAFAPFGEIIEAGRSDPKIINQGKCRRFHDLASLDFSNGRAGISIFNAEPRSFPYQLDMMERHPDGTQAFLPMTQNPFLIIVAEDKDNAPDSVQAFVSAPGQGINFHRSTWHGVLTPLHEPGLFAVVDRIGNGANLQEYWFKSPLEITQTAV